MDFILKILFAIIVHFLSCKGEGEFHDGDFTLPSGKTLIIDTTTFNASTDQFSTNITLWEISKNYTADQIYTYKIAAFKYERSITFKAGSVVIVTGENALSIQSKLGDITIATDISITCTTPRKTPENKRCLGGYRVDFKLGKFNAVAGSGLLYYGTGPGSGKITDQVFPNDCLNGAAHGGVGGGHRVRSGSAYAMLDLDHLLGGSSGLSSNNTTVMATGGGALELRAEHGTITIRSRISAASVNETNDQVDYSGGSGGTIRLWANEVIVRPGGSLNVDGSSGGGVGGWKNAGGGGGGVIQIISNKGRVARMSLQAGNSTGNCFSNIKQEGGQNKLPEVGYIYIRSKGLDTYKVFANGTNSTVVDFAWPQAPQGFIYLHMDRSLPALNKTKIILHFIQQGNGSLNASVVLDLIDELLKELSREPELTEEQLLHFVEIFKAFQEIVHLLAPTRPKDANEIFSQLMKLASSIMGKQNMKNWANIKKLPLLLTSVEAMGVDVANHTNASSIHQHTDSIVFQVASFESDEMVNGKYPDYSLLPVGYQATEANYVMIPEDATASENGTYKVIILMFKAVEDGMPVYYQSYRIGSLVLSCTLLKNGQTHGNLQKPAVLQLTKTKEKQQPVKHVNCTYWDAEKGNWETEGVAVASNNETHVSCHTHHFTSFALLMQHQDIVMTKAEQLSLVIITYIGCGISSGTLVITVIIFLSIEALSSERHRIHLNLVMALLLALVLFLAGITATQNKIVCSMVAAALHYFYTAAFTWMLIEGVHLYLKVVKVFRTESVKLRHYYIFGWGVPLIIVAISLAIKPSGYGTEKFCWLSLEDGFVWAFIGPVIAIITINCFILFMVVKTVVSSASSVRNTDNSHIRAGLKGALVLMPLLGVSWISGLLAVNRDTVVFQFIFAITNSLQGFFIFLLHVVFNTEVRTAFKRHREKHQLSKESDYNASFSSTHENNQTSMKRKSDKTSSSSSSGFGKLKARLSLSMLPRTSRVITVQPITSKSEDDTVMVNRAFTRGNSTNKLAPPKQDDELSSLNCPASLDAEPRPPYHRKLDSAKFKSNQI